jgi:subtilisin family serine protease
MFYDRDLRQLNNPPADLTSRADLVVTAQPSPGTYYVVVTSTDRSTGDYAVEYVGSPTPPADAGAVWLPTDPAAAAGLESPSANVVAEPPTPTNQYLVTLPALTDLPEGDRDAVVGALKTHAAETQAPAIRALEASGARVVNTFWLANAVVVEVDPQTVGVDPDGVEDWLGRVVPEAETVVANEPVWTLADATTVGGGDAADGAAATRLSAASTATVDSDVTQTDGIRTTYGLAQVRATEVWSEFGTRGAGVTVAVLDTGVDPAHPDIDLYTSDPTDPTYPGGWIQYDPAGRPIPGSVPSDSNGHGTHVSGTVAGGATGGVAIGVAPDVRLLHGGIGIPGTRSVTRAGAIAGMQWATENGADVISMSFGSTVREVPYLLPVRQATAAGVLVVVASGNDGPDVVGSPADVYDAVSVGVAGPMERILPWSSGTVVDTATRWGPAAPPDWPAQFVVPTVSAPGGATLSAKTVDTGYVAFSGTSMAAPHVAGVAALVIASADRDLSPQEVRNALVATARKPSGAPSGVDPRYGAGIVDALAAARLVTSAETPAPTPGIQGSGSLDGVGLRPSDVAVARAELAGRVR